MRTYKNVTKTENKLDRITCDICKRLSEEDGAWEDSKKHQYNEWEICIMLCLCQVIQNEGEWKRRSTTLPPISFDLCPDCFLSKLMPWLSEEKGKQ